VSEPSYPNTPPVAQRMQELLSRAVEEQVGEQRHLAEALTELRLLVSRLPAEVGDAASATSAGLAGTVESLRQELARTSAQVDTTATRLDALTARLEGVDELASRLPEAGAPDPGEAVESRLRTLSERLDAVEVEVARRLDGLQEAIAARLADVEAALPGERASLLADLTPRIDALSVGALNRGDVDAAVVPAIGAVAEVSDRVLAVSEGLEARVDSLETGIEKRLAELRSGVFAHIDEAVLALAAALLGGPASSAAPSAGALDTSAGGEGSARLDTAQSADAASPGHTAPPADAEEGAAVRPSNGAETADRDPESRAATARRRSWWKHAE
jgi:hypothetical protein